jgi:RHS repeat-associated protein
MHAPTAAGNKAYSYDANGQMTTKPGYTLVWDARNHLVLSTGLAGILPGPVAPVAYRYDAFGNRVSKGSTRYLLVDNQVVAEFANGEAKQYCYGSYIDEVLAEFSFNSAFSIQHSAFYSRNRQYNTVGLTNSVAELVEAYSTDAMGRVKAFDAAASAKSAPTATNVLFTGRVWDVETGLYYFRARYFEPELGVFISRDPLGFVDGQSVYQGWFELQFEIDYEGLACTQRTQVPGEIKDNGCGAEKGMPFPNGGPTYDFTQACNAHDRCYGKCNSTRSVCDDGIYADMKKACSDLSIFNPMKPVCYAQALIYYRAIRIGGCSAYEAAQKAACSNPCNACPLRKCSSDTIGKISIDEACESGCSEVHRKWIQVSNGSPKGGPHFTRKINPKWKLCMEKCKMNIGVTKS